MTKTPTFLTCCCDISLSLVAPIGASSSSSSESNKFLLLVGACRPCLAVSVTFRFREVPGLFSLELRMALPLASALAHGESATVLFAVGACRQAFPVKASGNQAFRLMMLKYIC